MITIESRQKTEKGVEEMDETGTGVMSEIDMMVVIITVSIITGAIDALCPFL